MENLKNKVVIVTGGTSSIGGEISKEMCNQGAKVVMASLNDDNKLSEQLGDDTLYIYTDITKDDQLDNLVAKTVEKFGKIDVLINNACSYGDTGSSTDRQTWLDTLNVNVVSSAVLAEKCRPHLVKSKGCIINIGSISGIYPHIERWSYPVSKAALMHLTKTMAVEYASDGVRVNMLRLGHVWSDPFAGLTKNDRDHANKATAPFNLMGRTADGVEVGRVAAFIASEAGSYINGAEIPVDGGYSAMGPEGHQPLFPILAK